MAQLFVGPKLLAAGPGSAFYLAAVLDANNHLAIAQTPYYQTAAGILVPAPVDSNNNPQVALTGTSSWNNGVFDVPTSAAIVGTQAGHTVTLEADSGNADNVLIGNAANNATFPLSPGQSATLDVANLNLVYAVASATGNILYWAVN
jgi:hypothetical protein